MLPARLPRGRDTNHHSKEDDVDKVSKNLAQHELTQASHRTAAPKAAAKLLERARDLKGDVTREELARLLKPWT